MNFTLICQEESVRRVSYAVITLAALILFVFASSIMAGQSCGSAKAIKSAQVKNISAKATGQIVTLNVSNMTCGGCVSHVSKTLTAVEGVSDVKVNLENGTAVVNYDASKIETKALTAAVVKAGYPATLAETANVKSTKSMSGCDPKACGSKKACNPKACGMKKSTTVIKTAVIGDN